MNVAIIYTGEIRTLEKTLPYLKRNVILNKNVHLFATIQTNEFEKYKKILENELGENIKSIVRFIKNDEWLNLQQMLLNNMQIPTHSKVYLKNGGSMIEYRQLQMSYQSLVSYEKDNNIKYDYIIRCRTDTIFTKPIDFSWLNLSEEEISFRVKFITNLFKEENLPRKKLLTYFMSTIIHQDLLPNIENNYSMYDESPFPKEHQYINVNDPKVIDVMNANYTDNLVIALKEYIKHGSYILTIRQNLLYIVRRDFFNLIPQLSDSYGRYNFFQNEYWWNAESQFRSICACSQLSIFNYCSLFEEKSLYEYQRDRYFNEDGSLKKKEMLYCVVRQ